MTVAERHLVPNITYTPSWPFSKTYDPYFVIRTFSSNSLGSSSNLAYTHIWIIKYNHKKIINNNNYDDEPLIGHTSTKITRIQRIQRIRNKKMFIYWWIRRNVGGDSWAKVTHHHPRIAGTPIRFISINRWMSNSITLQKNLVIEFIWSRSHSKCSLIQLHGNRTNVTIFFM